MILLVSSPTMDSEVSLQCETEAKFDSMILNSVSSMTFNLVCSAVLNFSLQCMTLNLIGSVILKLVCSVILK